MAPANPPFPEEGLSSNPSLPPNPPSHAQEAMRAAEACSTEDCPVKMKLVAPPLYVLTTQTLDKNAGVEVRGLRGAVTGTSARMHALPCPLQAAWPPPATPV